MPVNTIEVRITSLPVVLKLVAASVEIGAISDLSASIVGTDPVLTFTPADGALEHEYRWGLADPPDSAPQPANEVGDNEEIPDGTLIYFQVRGKNGEDVGEWSNTASVTTPAELITNGTFDSNVTGWTPSTSTVTWDSGKLRVTGATGGAGFGRADQTVSGLTSGETYRFRIGAIAGSAPNPGWRIRQDSTSGAILVSGSGDFNPVDTTFVAPASGTVVVQLMDLSGSTSDFSTYDDVSLMVMV